MLREALAEPPWAQCGTHRVRGGLRRAAFAPGASLSRSDGDEAIYSAHGFLVYPIVIKASGATAVTAPERNLIADVDAILGSVIGGDPDGVSRQSEQSHRHLSAVQRGQAAACRALPRHCAAWWSMRPTPNMCGATTMKSGIELVSSLRQRGDAAHVLEGLRACRPAHRLGLLPGPCRRRAQSRQGRFQREQRRPSPRRWRRFRTIKPMSSAPSDTTAQWLAWLRGEIGSSGSG